MKPEILVTGGAGFIGSHTVVELFLAGYEPVILDNFVNSRRDIPQRIGKILGREVRVIEGDCTDERAMRDLFAREKSLAGVIHFAAYKSVSESVREPLKYHRNNIGSLLVLLKLMEEFGVKNLVFSSSCTVYGAPEVLPVTENSPVRTAESTYGYTKQVCEQIIQDQAAAEKGLKAILLRYFNPIGAHPSGLIGELPLGKPENLVPYITQTAAGLRDQLTIFGDDYPTPDGTAIRDYIHVVDLARAHVAALRRLESGRGENCEIFNAGTGRGASVKELVEAFERVTGVKCPHIQGARRPGDIASIWADATQVEQVLGWKAQLTMEDALRDAWNWQVMLGK
ncbi:MAG: UDP-glucose 4-epimerase GalE [Bacteroidia bacterium]|nr:UDP-glucose 4-epimerase GalE [Bacteroidia bacterium]